MDREQLEAAVRRSLTWLLNSRGRAPLGSRTVMDNQFVLQVLAAVDAYVAAEVPAVLKRLRELDYSAAAQDGRARRRTRTGSAP